MVCELNVPDFSFQILQISTANIPSQAPLGPASPVGLSVRECPLEALFIPAPAPEEAGVILSSLIVCFF